MGSSHQLSGGIKMAGVLDPILLFSLALLGSAGAACPNVPGWIPLQGSCYMTSPSPLTWFQAQEFCNTKGGYLAEITSAKESDLVSSVLSQDLEFWIGLNDLANWSLLVAAQLHTNELEQLGF